MLSNYKCFNEIICTIVRNVYDMIFMLKRGINMQSLRKIAAAGVILNLITLDVAFSQNVVNLTNVNKMAIRDHTNDEYAISISDNGKEEIIYKKTF